MKIQDGGEVTVCIQIDAEGSKIFDNSGDTEFFDGPNDKRVKKNIDKIFDISFVSDVDSYSAPQVICVTLTFCSMEQANKKINYVKRELLKLLKTLPESC